MARVITQRAVGIAVQEDDAGHTAVLHRDAMSDDGPRTDAEQDEPLDVTLAREEIHGGDDVVGGALLRGPLLVAMRAFTDSGEIDAKGKKAQFGATARERHIPAEGTNVVDHAGVEPEHRGRNRRR